MGRRILNDALRTMVNAEKRGFASAQLQPISNVISSFLTIMKQRGYVKNFEVYDPHRVGKIKVELLGRIKDCRAITYRQDIKAHEIENYRLRTLPTQQEIKEGNRKDVLANFLCKTVTRSVGRFGKKMYGNV